MEASHDGPQRSALVGLVGSPFPMSFTKTQALLDLLLGVEITSGVIATIRQRLSPALAQPMAEAFEAARQPPVANVVDEVLRPAVEPGPPTGNANGINFTGRRSWQRVMVTAVV